MSTQGFTVPGEPVGKGRARRGAHRTRKRQREQQG